MLTLVPHLLRLKTAGDMPYLTLVYTSGLIYVSFWLKTEKETYVMGERTFKDTVEFTSTEDLMDELLSTEGLVEVTVVSMG